MNKVFVGTFCVQETQSFLGLSSTNDTQCCFVNNKGQFCSQEASTTATPGSNPRIPACHAHSLKLFSGTPAYKMTYFTDSGTFPMDDTTMIFQQIAYVPVVRRSTRTSSPRA